MEELLQTVSSRFPAVNRSIPLFVINSQANFVVTMTSLIGFDSSPMTSPIEPMHFDSSFTKLFGLHRFLPSSKHHIDVFGGFLGPQILGLIRVD